MHRVYSSLRAVSSTAEILPVTVTPVMLWKSPIQDTVPGWLGNQTEKERAAHFTRPHHSLALN